MGFYQKFDDLLQEKSKNSAIASFLKHEQFFLHFEKVVGEPAFELKTSSSKWEGDSKVVRPYECDSSFEWDFLKKPLTVQAFKPFLKLMPSDHVYAEALVVEKNITSVFFLHRKNEETLNLLKILSLKCELLQKEESPLFTEASFLQNLYAEIFRSRKLKLPVSCILIECVCEGKKAVDSQIKMLLKSVRNHLIKQSKVYDLVVPVGSRHLALILPHVFESLALNKAREFYSALKSLEDFKVLKYSVKFKMAVSEYPKSARDASGLLNLMKQALSQGEGLCVARAAQGFRPDFNCRLLDEDISSEQLNPPAEESPLQTSV